MTVAGARWSAPRSKAAIVTAVIVALASVVLSGCSSGKASSDVSVFVFAGQSNMLGLGSQGTPLPPALARTNRNTFYWLPSTRTWTSTPLTPGGIYGPEVSAINRLARELGHPVAAVQLAVNGVSLAGPWDPSRPDGLYAAMKAEVDNALHSRIAGQGNSKVAGFFWMQGESDAQNPGAAAAYGVNLRRLLDQVRSDFASPRLPIVLGRIRAQIPLASPESAADVRSAIDRVAASTPNVRVVSTDALPLASDGLHFTGQGIITLGDEFADAYMKLDH
ncbi:MAG: hypothetical protein JO148_05765 [Acidimicrobiia bacterium]|nr:hypothetical protein [Acidimicrobiia bacterium]